MTRIVAPEIKAMLPQVLIDYLWGLIQADSDKESKEQTFTLVPGSLGGREIQDILHTCGNSSAWHRVFGIVPLRCEIQINNDNKSWYMFMDDQLSIAE